MYNVYEKCPQFEGEKFLLRQTSMEDMDDLLMVYSDEKSGLLFNSDNCEGDDFHYTTPERMKQAIEFWDFSYEQRYFVRWSILDKNKNLVIGTIELFNRQAGDYFTNTGLLRLDLRSDYEKEGSICEILNMILKHVCELFHCEMIATKAVQLAKERRIALEKLGFYESDHKLIGHDGTIYDSYFVLEF